MQKRTKLAALIAIPAAIAVGLIISMQLFAPGMFGEAAGARNGLDRFLAWNVCGLSQPGWVQTYPATNGGCYAIAALTAPDIVLFGNFKTASP